mgnify:CR=1 FL=1
MRGKFKMGFSKATALCIAKQVPLFIKAAGMIIFMKVSAQCTICKLTTIKQIFTI